MSYIRRHSQLLLVAVCCIALGAGASLIASAGAATGGSGHAGHSKHGKHGKAGKAGKAGGLRGFASRAVHGSVVVHAKQGFVTVTFDRGKVDSVNGRQLMITEGTKKAVYKTVTLDIPANALVRDNRQKATLAAVKPGQRVAVIKGPKRTLVVARTPRVA
jgi:hypothetical protein